MTERRAITLVPPSFLLGHARDLAGNSLRFYEECESKAELVRARAFHRPFFVVTGPEALDEVFVRKASSFRKPTLLRGLRWIFGDGLLTSEGDLWKQQRRTAQPMFSAKHLGSYGDEVVAITGRMLGKWGQDEIRDVNAELVDACLDSLGRMIFDANFEEERAVVAEAAKCVHMLAHSLSDLMAPSPLRLPFGEGVRMRRAFRALQQLAGRLIDRASAPGATSRSFVHCLLRARDAAGAPLPRRLVRDEIVTMLLAGHDTAAAAVSFALEFVARNPDVAAALEEELDRQLGGEPPRFADLERLPLLDDVILETYRLRPPTYRVGRTSIEECTIVGEPIPRGSDLICPQWAVHRSPRYYDDPETFRPSRWTPEFAEALPRFAFFPFGGGPRTCVGQRVVMAENALMLACVIQSFRVTPRPESRPAPLFFGLSLVPDGGLKLRVERRAMRTAHCPSATQPLSSRLLHLEPPEELLE